MKVEKHGIEFIPHEERHGNVKNLFNIWFGCNMHLSTIVIGALAIILGLNVFWSLVAVIVGNLIGGIFMATHSAQGPKLGIPQMIQSRAQFGVIGAILPLLIVLIEYIGCLFGAGSFGAQAMHNQIPQTSFTGAFIILSVVTLIVTVIGYDLIHTIEKYFTILSAIVFFVATIIIFRLPLPANSWAFADFNLAKFILVISITSSWLFTYAPYVADYARYLPKETSSAATFGYTYAGGVIGTTWMMGLGVLLAAALPNFSNNSTGVLANLFGSFSPIMYITIILGILAMNVLNLYGAYMSLVTVLEPFTKLRWTTWQRSLIMAIVTVIPFLMAISGNKNVTQFYNQFMMFLQYIIVPWSAINLVDFYYLRHGNYDVKDLFDLNGQYGKFNWVSIFAYIISIVVQIPFMNTTLYEGSISKALHGADLAWIPALLVPALIYYYPMKRKLSQTSRTVEETEVV